MSSSPASNASPWALAWQRFARRPAALLALGFLVLLVVVCVTIRLFPPYVESAQDLMLGAAPPSWQHWFGTDLLGRDIATRLCFGGCISLSVAAAATAVSVLIGVTYGLVSGLAGSRQDALMMRVVDILYAFPFMVFVILLAAVFNRSLLLLFCAIGAVEWLTMSRVVRAQTLALKKQEFITAARAYGASWSRILIKHLLPNVAGTVVVYATLTVPGVMLMEATLSFLGLGVQPPAASWGTLIFDGTQAMQNYPWMLIAPAVVFTTTLLALNIVGDALRDVLDPRSVQS